MSGMGGGVGPGGGGGGTDCYDYYVSTVVNSPNPLFLDAISEDEILSVELETSGRVLLYDEEENLIGSVTPDSIGLLIKCLKSGIEFVAIVEEIDGGFCKVSIQPGGEL